MASPPASVLIVGSGVFGLTTALHLSLRRPATRITVLDRAAFPAADGSSIDSSRIVRADYSDAAYSRLAAEAQASWRGRNAANVYGGRLGADGRYHESGLALVSDGGEVAYVEASLRTVAAALRDAGEDPRALQPLRSPADIAAVYRGGASGARGYVNWGSGWADAEASMRFVRALAAARPNIAFEVAEAAALLDDAAGAVCGVACTDGREFRAELTVLAAGAWTPGLVDLRGRAVATGQAVAYVDISPEEQAELAANPVLFNLTTGCFVIPPAGGQLKIARHHIGYVNPAGGHADGVSVPRTAATHPDARLPAEAEAALRRALADMAPRLAGRPWARTRMCWYTDTPHGDFIVCYHPHRRGLFLATGGSGHAFKFLPVLGDEIVDILERRAAARFAQKWAWPRETVDEVATRDGSRAGERPLVLEDAPAPVETGAGRGAKL